MALADVSRVLKRVGQPGNKRSRVNRNRAGSGSLLIERNLFYRGARPGEVAICFPDHAIWPDLFHQLSGHDLRDGSTGHVRHGGSSFDTPLNGKPRTACRGNEYKLGWGLGRILDGHAELLAGRKNAEISRVIYCAAACSR